MLMREQANQQARVVSREKPCFPGCFLLRIEGWHALRQDVDTALDLVLGDGEGRDEAQDIPFPGSEGEETMLESSFDQRAGGNMELNADEQAQSPDLLHVRIAPELLLQKVKQELPLSLHSFEESRFLYPVENCKRCFAYKWSSSKCAPMVSVLHG